MDDQVFSSVGAAWLEAMKHLKDERINAVEIHWGHGTITLQQKFTRNGKRYEGWELIEDA